MNNKKVLTELLRRLTIQIEGAEIPALHKGVECIVLPCYEGCVIDIKPQLSFNKVNKGGEKVEG